MSLNNAKDAVSRLLKYYLNRRRETVVEVMVYFRPNLVAAFELQDAFGIDDLQPYHERYLKNFKNDATHFSGEWKGSWRYQLHGIGCEMVNVITGEHFDWDISDPFAFSTAELTKYLEWYSSYNEDDENLKSLLNWSNDLSLSSISAILVSLKEDGVLENISENEWLYRGLISHD